MRSKSGSIRSVLAALGVGAMVCLVAGAGAGYAQEAASVDTQQVETPPPVLSMMEAFVVDTDSEGTETFRVAQTVDPGETIEYRIVHKNQSSQPLGGFIVTGPIPEGTRYVAGSASQADGAIFEVKLPDEDWQGEPAYKTIVNEDGREERVIADPSEYTAVRWSLTAVLADQATAEGIYRVRVNSN